MTTDAGRASAIVKACRKPFLCNSQHSKPLICLFFHLIAFRKLPGLLFAANLEGQLLLTL